MQPISHRTEVKHCSSFCSLIVNPELKLTAKKIDKKKINCPRTQESHFYKIWQRPLYIYIYIYIFSQEGKGII